jgi:hypothetical protein
MSNLNDETQIGHNHKRSRFSVALFNARGQINLLLRGQQRDLPDFSKLNFNARIWIFTGHISRSVPFFEIDSHVLLKFIGVRSHN